MKIKYKTGNLLKSSHRVILHGCNARGVMGAGIAKQIRDLYPEAYSAYRKAYEAGSLVPGGSIWVKCGERIIINGITQKDYGRRENYVIYDAVERVMEDIEAHWNGGVDHGGGEIEPVREVAMPLIGAGLAGGDWSRIAYIIESKLQNVQPIVYTLDGRVPR